MMRIMKDIPYTQRPGERNTLDLYLPEGEGSFPCFVYFYGGGLTNGEKADSQALAEGFARAGIAVAVPNYRLYPAAAYPAFIEDAAEAVAFVAAHRADYGLSELFVGGWSAGAYLAMMLCFDKRYLAAHGIDPDALAGFLFISGQTTKHFTVLDQSGEDPRRIIVDETAPLYHIRSTGAPLLILVADHDMENRLEQNQLLVGTLRHYQYPSPVLFHIVENMDHGGFDKPRGDRPSAIHEAGVPFIRTYAGRGA
ncbi:MAG: alpha/beta hydrolase [Oscillospiraceae bacterium]|jgi:acetyl esterase/lipase|nr:alpha/beta hydrolase [Oscillospiraceae bacterium]